MAATLRQVLKSSQRERLQLVLSRLDAVADLGIEPPSHDCTLDTLLDSLKIFRSTEPNHASTFTRLDAIIIPLWQIQRDMDVIGPLDPPPGFASPSQYDVMISDFGPKDLPDTIARVMGVEYLSQPERIASWPLAGKVWGINRRILFTLPVSVEERAVNTHFLFDTGAPATFVSKSVIGALGLEEWQLGDKLTKVNGVRMVLNLSDGMLMDENNCHFHGINLLGMDYIDKISAKVTIDMANNAASIDRQAD